MGQRPSTDPAQTYHSRRENGPLLHFVGTGYGLVWIGHSEGLKTRLFSCKTLACWQAVSAATACTLENRRFAGVLTQSQPGSCVPSGSKPWWKKFLMAL